MIEQAADKLQQIVSLFRLTQPLAIPSTENCWIEVEAIDLSETAALCLALGFFLRRTGNRAGPVNIHTLKSNVSLIPKTSASSNLLIQTPETEN